MASRACMARNSSSSNSKNPLKALPSLVSSAYAAAVAGGHVIFSETELAIVRTRSGLPFQLRLCPALSKKGGQRINDLNGTRKKDNHEHGSSGHSNGINTTKRPDPFDNPPPAMTVANLPPDHLLVLNKYPVIPRHFLLVTREFKEQSGDLDKADLAAMYGCLEAWRASEVGDHDEQNGMTRKDEDTNESEESMKSLRKYGRQLYAFYNCGEQSGASQPHRHIQFLPIEDMKQDQERWDDWDLLLNGPAGKAMSLAKESTAKELPISYFTTPIPPNPSPEILHDLYLTLLRRARSRAISKQNPQFDAQSSLPQLSLPRISYNLGCTTSTMALCPRQQAGSVLRHPDKDEDIGVVELNGCLLAGTAMVKTHEEWAFLRDGEERMDGVLRDIGFSADNNGRNEGDEKKERRILGGVKTPKI